ncbi:MAG: hypothetical protein HN712_28875 [Gemmatimonadetes bacterium]|jgi:uncharacterized lipoprotein YddW (UPF0748 family)|nr:hypothetical protein [Gemmatimonadota bacterium]MBT7864359.1 hypothetical protein [Gemmatimonadota bacterium]
MNSMTDDGSTYLLDMGRAGPAEAISNRLETGCWLSVPYTVEAGEGQMLFATRQQAPPEIRLDLGVTGWHRIHIATFRHFQFAETLLLLKLASDPAFTRAAQEDFRRDKDLVAEEMIPGPMDLSEAYWKTVDLQPGEQLVLHRPMHGTMGNALANIAYVRLMPVAEDELEIFERESSPRPDTPRLMANYDGGQHLQWAYGSRAEVADEFQAFANGDFKMVLWGVARSFQTFYPSKVADPITSSPLLPGVFAAMWEAHERARTADFDPLAAAVACAHDVGLEIYPQLRMAGEKLPPIHLDAAGPGSFQTDHPEFRCLTAEGKPTRHLSHAFPEVRERYVRLFREWVEDYDADGVNILFNRSWPFALSEVPVVDSFREMYGEEMTDLDDTDVRVLRHRASFVTQTLRATRQMLDDVGRAKGRTLGLCCLVSSEVHGGAPDAGPFSHPLYEGVDVEAWVREGLVDHLVVNIQRAGDAAGQDAAATLKPYIELARGTKTQVYADLYPRRQSGNSMRIRAKACYDAGVDGLCFWDCQKRSLRLSGWAMHRQLGHRDELGQMKPYAERLFRVVPLKCLDGFDALDPACQPTDG